MALSEEQKKVVQEYFDKFEDTLEGELRNTSNQTTSFVKSAITKYMEQARNLYYRNAINEEMFTSLKGMLYKLSGELQNKMLGKEVENVNNPLEKKDYISEDKFNALLKEWVVAYNNLLKDRMEIDPENFTNNYIKKVREKFLKGDLYDPAFDNFNKLVKNGNLSNKQQNKVIEQIDKITIEYLNKTSNPDKSKEGTLTTRGDRVLEKFKDQYEKKFRKIISDLIDKAENTIEKLDEEKEKLFKELIQLKNEGSLGQSDANIIAKSLNEIYKENASKFNSEARLQAEKEKLVYATNPEKAVLSEDFNDTMEVAGQELKGILYAPMEKDGLKKGAYTLSQGFDYFTKKIIRTFDLSKHEGSGKIILAKLKAEKESIIEVKIDKGTYKIVFDSKLKTKLLNMTSTSKEAKNFYNSDFYYAKNEENILFSNKELCFINNYKKVFINYQSKKEYVKQSVDNKVAKEPIKNDSFAFLKFKFEDGTVIECLDNENKSRDEVLAEAKKVYAQMKRRG